MASDGALLAMIVDDKDALAILSAWAALGPPLTSLDDPAFAKELCAIVSISIDRVRISLRKLRLARVLVDGGISELADRMLQQLVSNHINGAKKKR